MVANRMNRDEFYAAMAPSDEARLRKILWTLYWRGDARLLTTPDMDFAVETDAELPPRAREVLSGARPVPGVARPPVSSIGLGRLTRP